MNIQWMQPRQVGMLLKSMNQESYDESRSNWNLNLIFFVLFETSDYDD